MTERPAYLTPKAIVDLRKELDHLKTDRRKEVADRIEKAKELGDLRENAEYHDAKDELAWLEGRILELEDVISRSVVVEQTDTESVGIGNTVRVTNGEKERTFIITGSVEADPLQGKISNESPLGRAFIGKKAGETAEVEAPAGTVRYTILAIE